MIDPAELSGHLLQSATLLGNHLAGPVKAMLYCVDKPSLSVTLQFNPATFRLDRGIALSTGNGKIFAGFEPGHGRNDTLVFETWLDESELTGKLHVASSLAPYTFNTAGNTASVLSAMEDLYKLTLPGEYALAAAGQEARPPVVVFMWEKFKFTGIVSVMSFDVKLFDVLGAPRRASVNMQMEGRAFWSTNDPWAVLEDTADAQTFVKGMGADLTYAAETTSRAVSLRLLNRLV